MDLSSISCTYSPRSDQARCPHRHPLALKRTPVDRLSRMTDYPGSASIGLTSQSPVRQIRNGVAVPAASGAGGGGLQGYLAGYFSGGRCFQSHPGVPGVRYYPSDSPSHCHSHAHTQSHSHSHSHAHSLPLTLNFRTETTTGSQIASPKRKRQRARMHPGSFPFQI